MNNDRRKKLNEIINQLRSAADTASSIHCDFDSVLSEEREAFENMPEGLQQSEKGQAISEGLDTLDSALDMLDNTLGDLNQIADDIESTL